MPTYLGQEVDQSFLDWIVYVYRGGWEAAHPDHTPVPKDDATLIADMEATTTLGGPDADAVARYLANPPVVREEGGHIVSVGGGGQAWPKEGWPSPKTKKP